MRLKTKALKKFVFFMFIVAFLLIGKLLLISNTIQDEKTLINISSLPQDVMKNYFDSFSEMVSSDNKENILIVTSNVPIKETYGAVKVVDAPNYQYFLQYENEEDKAHALNMFESLNIKVSENKTYKFVNDNLDETTSTYNSWGIEAMRLDKANELVETIDNLPEITVAIIDTGLDVDLMDRYFPGKVDETYNVLDPDGEILDEYGHGTHIAGTIAEGTSSNVKILPIKVSDDGFLSDVDIITAINYVTYYEKADVINMSFSGDWDEEATEATRVAIEAAKEKNIISVAAAGNEYTSKPSYPSGYDNTISVSAVDSHLSLADYSNYGKMITFTAPGSDIKSIMSSDAMLSEDDDDDFETISGTSMATPHVVSAVAILKSIKPNISFDETVDVLKEHTVDLGAKGWDSLFGYGLISFDGIKFCDRANSSDCDKYSIFEKFVPDKIEVSEVVLTPYNYGSLTNILATVLTITSTNGETIEKRIDDFNIDEYEISGYDPYSLEEQTVTLSYSGFEINFVVKNPDEYESGWEYSVFESGNNNITGYALTGYKDHALGIKALYFPNTMSDGTPVVALGGKANKCMFGVYSSSERSCVGSVDALNYSVIVLPRNIGQIVGTYTLGGTALAKGTLSNLERIVSYVDELVLSSNLVFSQLTKLYSLEANIFLGEYEGAFWGDTLLAGVTLSDNNTIIPASTFRNCKNISEIAIPESVEKIGDYAFSGAGINELHISKDVKKIGIGILETTDQLASITVSEDNLWYYSPEGSNAIIEVESDKLIAGSSSTIIPDTVKIIGKGALLDVDLSEINIPEGVTTIEDNSVYSLDIEKIVLPNSLEYISDHAFGGINNSCLNYRAGYCSVGLFSFWVHRDSFAFEWVREEDYGYTIIEELDESSKSMHISWVEMKTRARAFDVINDDNTDIYVYFANEEGTSELDPVRATVVGAKYINNFLTGEENSVNHLVAGINSFKVIFDIGAYHNISTSTYYIYIKKGIPEYILPTGLEADPGQRLSEIALPDGFEWKNPDTVISGAGNLYYQAIFTPEDTENYEIVNDVFICIFVRTDKEMIEPTFDLSDSVIISDDPLPITQDEIIVNGFEPIDGDGVGYEITSFDYWINDEEEKLYIIIDLRMSDKQFESHYFSGPGTGGKQEDGFDIVVDAVYSSNPFIGAYDGNDHSISFNLGERYSQCAISYSNSGDGEYNLTDQPVFREIGTYDVYYRVDCGEKHSFVGSNKVMITGFMINDSMLRGDKLRILSNKPEDLLNSIQSIGDEDLTIRILNSDEEEIDVDENTILATGYILEIQAGSEIYDFEMALVGDLTSDGLVDERDFEKMKQHLIGTELLKGIYFLAGDISDNSLINSGDLLKLKQRLLGITRFTRNMSNDSSNITANLSSSDLNVYVGDSFTVSLSIDTVVAWNIHISSDGPVNNCILIDVDTSSDALNTEKEFTVECLATDVGEITVSLSGDYTTEDGVTIDLSDGLVVTVDKKEKQDEDEDLDLEEEIMVPDTGTFSGMFDGMLGVIPLLVIVIGVGYVSYKIYDERKELFHRVKFNKK